MPFKKGKSGNPTGRPAGANGKLTSYAQAFLNENQEHIVREGWEKAKNGDSQLHKVFLERVLPPAPKEIKVDIELENRRMQAAGSSAEFSKEIMSLSLATWKPDKLERFIRKLEEHLKYSSMSEDDFIKTLKQANIEAAKEATEEFTQ